MVKGTSVWKEVGGLSYGARGLRAVSVNNTVLVFGRKSKQPKQFYSFGQYKVELAEEIIIITQFPNLTLLLKDGNHMEL